MCDDHSHSAGHHRHPLRPQDLEDPLTLGRRSLLGAAAGGLFLSGIGSSGWGSPALAAAKDSPARPKVGAARSSRITRGTTLVHADLHNHTLMSDGDGDPAEAFASMRAAGLDVAALTDHSTASDHLLGGVVDALPLPAEIAGFAGLTRDDWRRTGLLADKADKPGKFTAIRGFEWTEPTLGHVNVWFSDDYTDVLDLGQMGPLYRWLTRTSGPLGLGDGGLGAIAGFNHPGREPFRFEEFRFDPRARDAMVSLEMFNRRDDYLFEGYADGKSSPLVACLNAGWRTGITGVTDEHADRKSVV